MNFFSIEAKRSLKFQFFIFCPLCEFLRIFSNFILVKYYSKNVFEPFTFNAGYSECCVISTKEQPIRSNRSVDIGYHESLNAQSGGGLIDRALE